MTVATVAIGLVAAVGAAASIAAWRALMRLLAEVGDHLRVLHVSINGLEAKVASEATAAREASEAALVRVGDLVAAMERLEAGAEVETARESEVREALGGRVKSARALFAMAEAESASALDRLVGRG